MIKVFLFAEDYGHEAFVTALIKRLAAEHGLEVDVDPRSVRGGHGAVVDELRTLLHEFRRGLIALPDLLVVATDANCKAHRKRRKDIERVTQPMSGVIPRDHVVYAIPVPHVERWALLDSAAFRAVLGTGCKAPDKKCKRDRYKELFAQAVRDANVNPIIGGTEHFEDIVNAMDLQRMRTADSSLGSFLSELATAFARWASE